MFYYFYAKKKMLENVFNHQLKLIIGLSDLTEFINKNVNSYKFKTKHTFEN